jgi:cell division protein FtsZ
VLFAIYGAEDLGMYEVQEAAKIITESVDKDAKIIFGIATDATLKKDEIKVTVIATGFPSVFVNKPHQPIHTFSQTHEETSDQREIQNAFYPRKSMPQHRNGLLLEAYCSCSSECPVLAS